MIEKYTISKDDKYYRAFTDLIEINGRLICSFSEMNKETKEYNICYCNLMIKVSLGVKERLYNLN